MNNSTKRASSSASSDVAQLRDRLGARDRWAIRVARSEHVICIGNGNDPRKSWDLVRLQSIRIAGSVDSFVVGQDDRRDLLVALDPAYELRAVDRVLADDLEIGLAQRPISHEDAIRERELADVVKQAGGVNDSKLVLRTVRGFRYGVRVARDRSRVPRRIAIAERQRPDHRHEHAELERREPSVRFSNSSRRCCELRSAPIST